MNSAAALGPTAVRSLEFRVRRMAGLEKLLTVAAQRMATLPLVLDGVTP